MNKLIQAIERGEAAIRKFLTNYPVLYTGLTALAIVVFWEGVSEIARSYAASSGPFVLIVISVPVLIVLGTFLPFFITDKKVLSELTHEEKEIERVERVEEKDTSILHRMEDKMLEMDREIHDIEKKVGIKK